MQVSIRKPNRAVLTLARRFLADRTRHVPGVWTSHIALFHAFKQWAWDRGYTVQVGQIGWGRVLASILGDDVPIHRRRWAGEPVKGRELALLEDTLDDDPVIQDFVEPSKDPLHKKQKPLTGPDSYRILP